MKFNKIIFLVFILCIGIINNVSAVSPQKKMFDGLLVETGTSTENIMPLLANIAGRQQIHFNRKGYFKRIYGQYRGSYILIKIDSNGKINSVKELKTITEQIAHNIITGYPSSEGRLEINSYPPELWDSMVVRFKKGKVISRELSPAKELIDKRIQIRSIKPQISVKDKLVFDLEKGEFNGIRIGDSMTPEDVVKLMGKQPEDLSMDVYSYYRDGIEFAIYNKSGHYYCGSLSIFLKDTKQEEILGNRVWNYKAFKGQISPLDKRDSMERVKSKLGAPDDFMKESFDGFPRFTYNTSYGTVYIYFDKRTGVVDSINIFGK